MRRKAFRSIALLAVSLAPFYAASAAPAGEGIPIGLPGFPLSHVAPDGSLSEDWGSVRLHLKGEGLPEPAWAAPRRVMVEGFLPAARAEATCGALTLETTAFRAPAWPAGLDVLQVRVAETAGRPASVDLSLELEESASVGETLVSAGGRAVLSLPPGVSVHRQEREWGCNGDAVAMPGWGKPAGECDPAFRNIRAGMGGVPVLYRFPVAPRAAVCVALGICESHWAEPGQRPVLCRVEGAPTQELDPVARWGQHKPGVLLFQGKDADGDGRLEVGVLPHPAAPDQNPILNAIWFFAPGWQPKPTEVISGRLTTSATRYVDVGGKEDQTLYLPGRLEYRLTLRPREARELEFVVACRGASVPAPERTAWSAGSLRRAAVAFWDDWFSQGAPLSLPDAAALDGYREALARLALFRHQADGFFLPLGTPGDAAAYDPRTLQEVTGALDLAGFTAEAERGLRVCWDGPVPQAYTALAPDKGGRWPGDAASQAQTCLALGRHAALGAPQRWLDRAGPAVSRRAAALAAAPPIGDAAPVAASALLACSRLAPESNLDDRARAISPSPPAPTAIEPANPDARRVWSVRTALVHEEGNALLLLPAVPEAWLAGPGLKAERLPTLFGPTGLQARLSDGKLIVRALLPAGLRDGQALLCVPECLAKAPRTATVNGLAVAIRDGRIPVPGGVIQVEVR